MIPTGTIAMFWGLEIDIPPGWQAADGTGGTIDLRDFMIIGAGSVLPPHLSNINRQHRHDFTSDGHAHRQPTAVGVGAGITWDDQSDSNVLTGQTDRTTMLPPYIALIYVQKI